MFPVAQFSQKVRSCRCFCSLHETHEIGSLQGELKYVCLHVRCVETAEKVLIRHSGGINWDMGVI